LPRKRKKNLIDEDDDYGEFEDEAVGLIELVDREAVELAAVRSFWSTRAATLG
jgi:hypothetical protein